MRGTVAVGMSGGVDSSVAAALLVQQGYQVIGVTMDIWDGELVKPSLEGQQVSTPSAQGSVPRHACFGPEEGEDAERAAEVCRLLGIPHRRFDVRSAYRAIVLDDFSREYRSGRTPNPCVRCNSRVKFGALLDAVRSEGLAFDHFATGHYVQNGYHESYQRILLRRAADLRKDQSYFLYRLDGAQVRSALFPLGGLSKVQVKRLASDFGLGFDDIPESQDFYGGDHSGLFDFVPTPGDIVNEEGMILGRHGGISRYTVGQRRDLGIASDRPLYVIRIDPQQHQVIVGYVEQTFGEGLIARDMVWHVDTERLFGKEPVEVEAKVRSQQQPFPVRIEPLSEEDHSPIGSSVRVTFMTPQRITSPGQSIVLYDEEWVIGGGLIEAD